MFPPEVRRYLREQTRDRMLAALPFFVQALEQNLAAIKGEEKVKAEWASALVEIFMGFGAPIFARLLVSKAGVTGKLAGEISAITKTTRTAKHAKLANTAAEASQKAEEYAWEAAKLRAEATAARAALKAKQGGRQTMKAAEAAAAEAMMKASVLDKAAEEARKAYQDLAPVELIGDNELLKATVTGATKVTTTLLKQKVTLLWGEDDLNIFANQLGSGFHHAVDRELQKLNRDKAKLPDDQGVETTDDQLLGLYIIYDPDNADVESYRAILKEKLEAFKTYVRVIEQGIPGQAGKYGDYYGTNIRAVWRTRSYIDGGVRQLWLLKEEWRKGRLGGGDVEREFISRVPKEMESFVIAKMAAEFENEPIMEIRM
jgi:hypothetical protein